MPKTYDQLYQESKAKYEESHPNEDYDEYINGLIDEAKK